MWEFREAQSLCSQGWPLTLDPLMALCLLLDCLMLTINVTVLHLWNVITYLEWKLHARWWAGHLQRQKGEISSLQSRDLIARKCLFNIFIFRTAEFDLKLSFLPGK